MSTLLYNFLPTELVWDIYEILHTMYMKDLCQELTGIQFSVVESNRQPFLCRIGECECDGPCNDDYDESRCHTGRMLLRRIAFIQYFNNFEECDCDLHCS